MEQKRQVVPPIYLLLSLVSMTLLHNYFPIAWVVPSNPDESRVINPGRPDLSSLVQRARSRRPSSQMPPIGTVVQDTKAIDLLTTWVQSNPEECASIVARCAGS